MKKPFLSSMVLCLAAAYASGCTALRKTTDTPTPALPPGDTTHIITTGSMQRSFLLHVPPGFSHLQPAALVFVFHGMSEDGAYMSQVTGFNEVSDAEGFLVVYPNGTVAPGPLSWNAGGCCGNALDNQTDEAAFIRAILDDLSQKALLDPKRIYAAGFSNGGMLAYRLGCEMSETFAAIAPVSGILAFSPCQPQEPVSVIHIHGNSDVSVPFKGGGTNPSSGLPFTSVERGIAAWVQLDGCEDSPVKELEGIVMYTAYESCRNGTAVELYVLKGLGHAWPVSSVLPAARTIWDFFAAHPKP